MVEWHHWLNGHELEQAYSMGSQSIGHDLATEQQQQKHTGLPRWLRGKESTCQWGRCGFDPWVGKIPWKRKWQPTLVFLLGKSHGERNLVGYSP